MTHSADDARPQHPGAFIRSEIVQERRLTVTEAAELLHVSRPTLSNLLGGRADLSGLMAVRIEKVFGVPMEMLMGLQSAFDIAKARDLRRTIKLQRYRSQPVRRRKRKGA